MIFPLGYKLGFYEGVDQKEYSYKDSTLRKYTWSFVGALKSDRIQMIQNMKLASNSCFLHNISNWNSKDSLSTKEYKSIMEESIFLPCGLGTFNLDTFRLCEALECGCIPIVLKSSRNQPFNYWERLFEGEQIPFIMLDNWEQSVDIVKNLMKDTKELEKLRLKNHNWWLVYKKNLKERIKNFYFS
jgi:hypothetical protein